MPELPDVAVFKKYLDSTSLQKKIIEIKVKDKRILEKISVERFKEKAEGCRMKSSSRHGKYLFINLDSSFWLYFHFGMTGRLKYFKKEGEEPDYGRIFFSFSNGYHLAYASQRMLGKVGLIEKLDKFIEKKELGPDALEINFPEFRRIFEGRRGTSKSALMNQKLIAGLGNIYADEVLFHAGIRPDTQVESLNRKKLKDIFLEMNKVLQKAIQSQANPDQLPDSYLLPHRGKKGTCPRSHGQLERVKISGRYAYFCPCCQS